MKRWAKRIGAGCGGVLLVIGLFVGWVAYSAFGGKKGPEDHARYDGGHIEEVVDGFTVMYILDAGHDVVLVDAGNDTAGVALLAALRTRGLGPERVRAVLLSHGHTNHTAALHILPSTEVYALAEESELVAGTVAAGSPLGRLRGAAPTGLRVTHPLHDGDVLHFDDLTVEVFAVPGHTAGSAVYLARGGLFLGDSAGASSDGRVEPAVSMFSDNAAQNQESLRALAHRLAPRRAEVRWLFFGHQGALEGLGPLEAFAQSR